MKKLLLILFCISSYPGLLLAQESELPVQGRVVSVADSLPLPGASVTIKGTLTGTITDPEGQFALNVPEGAVLVISYIGYTAREVPVNTATSLTIALEEDYLTLGEIEVYSTGYQELPAERATGSFSHIGKELLDRSVGPDLISRLQGITPGLLMDRRNGDKTFLNIRGRSTILADDQPLIVVDNFPFNGDISAINPNDIESITILRDAAAASIWGVRAGNGVIVITTKKGRAGEPLRISANTNVTIGEQPDLFYENSMSSSEIIDVEKMLFDNAWFDATLNDTRMPAVTPVVEILQRQRNGDITTQEATARLDALRGYDVRKDLSKYFYRKSANQQYAVNINGGSEKHTWYFSTGYDRNLSNRVGNQNDRLSLNTQHTFRPIKNLAIDARLVYTQSNIESDNTLSQIRMGSHNIYPYARLTDDAGNPVSIMKDYREEFVADAGDKGFLNWEFNPLEELDYSDNSTRRNNIRVATGLRYSITPALSIDARYQYEIQSSGLRILQPVESYYTRDLINRFSAFDGNSVTERHIPEGGILTFTNSDVRSNSGRAQINFNKDWQQHSVNALAGIEIRETEAGAYSNRLYGYDPNLGSSTAVNYTESFITYPNSSYVSIPGLEGISGTIDRFRSWFVNAAYTFRERYTLSASGRVDQSNLFGVNANQRSAPLWSVGGKWSIHQEEFFKVSLFPLLALRVTYGYNGNIDRNVTAFTTGRFSTASLSRRSAARLVNPPNPELRWERSGMINVGIDFGTRNSTLMGSIEYYRKNGRGLMGRGPLEPTKGLDAYKGNIASMKGQGLDVELKTINIDRALRWNTNIIFSYNTDEVTHYELNPTSIVDHFRDGSISRSSDQFTPVEGKPLFGIYSYPWAGLDPATGDPMGYLNGEASVNYAAISSAATVDSLVYHGRALPPYFGALRNTINYKGWSLSFNITYRFGYYFRRNSISYSNLFGYYDGHGDFKDRWQQPGDELATNVPSMVYPANSSRDAFYTRSEVLVEKGDNIRWQDVTLSFDFGEIKLGKLGFRQLQVYSYINNIGLIWKANKAGLDPDFPNMPLPRTYAFGVRMKF